MRSTRLNARAGRATPWNIVVPAGPAGASGFAGVGAGCGFGRGLRARSANGESAPPRAAPSKSTAGKDWAETAGHSRRASRREGGLMASSIGPRVLARHGRKCPRSPGPKVLAPPLDDPSTDC